MTSHTVQSVAELLARARKEKGITQAKLADLLGLPQSYVARIEAGKTDLRASKLIEIARLLDLEVLFVHRKDLPNIEWSMADDTEMNRRQIYRSAYEPDEDSDDDEEIY